MKDDYKSGPHYSGKAQKLNSQTLIKCKRYETMSRRSETTHRNGKIRLGALSAVSKWTMRDVKRESALNQM